MGKFNFRAQELQELFKRVAPVHWCSSSRVNQGRKGRGGEERERSFTIGVHLVLGRLSGLAVEYAELEVALELLFLKVNEVGHHIRSVDFHDITHGQLCR
jgi:hypothetical protein